ncbi:MAG: hypothetical protein CM15mP62_33640 [Rhodospirillaceae bacterium]|nr:MAG: hypothetical protein CM15mP62_33640 [Rhodospirillaceae bacterium]
MKDGGLFTSFTDIPNETKNKKLNTPKGKDKSSTGKFGFFIKTKNLFANEQVDPLVTLDLSPKIGEISGLPRTFSEGGSRIGAGRRYRGRLYKRVSSPTS